MRGFTTGDRVLHAQYGPGTLIDVNQYLTVIDFDEHDIRRFVTDLVALQRTQIPAPERRVKSGRKSTRGRRPRG